jgi:hypothetical protein
MAFDAFAIMTNEAKRRTMDGHAYGTAFQVKYFSISDGGYDPADPTTALAIDPAATTMPGVPFIVDEVIDDYAWFSDMCPTFVCQVDKGQIVGTMSSIGLTAEVLWVGPARPAGAPAAPALGYKFLYAVYNRPQLILTATDGPTIFNLTPFM